MIPKSVSHWAKYYPPDWGGMERVTYDLATGMAERGVAVEVVAFAREAVAAGDEEADGVRVLRRRQSAAPANQPLSVGWVMAAVQSALRTGSVLIHGPNPLAVIPMMFVRLIGLFNRRRIKMTIFWHADIPSRSMFDELLRPLEHVMIMLCDAVIATSVDYATASISLQRHKKKLHIVPLGISPALPDIHGEPPKPLRAFIYGKPVVLAVGRLVPYKGFEFLIDAATAGDGTYAVVIVGGGPLEEGLISRIKGNGASDKVMLAGKLPEDELDALYAQATLFAMTSTDRAEAFGVVLLEAMAYSKPMIVRHVEGSGVGWVAGVGARVIRTNDPKIFASEMKKLVTDETACQSLGTLGHARFLKSFSKDAMVEGALAVL